MTMSDSVDKLLNAHDAKEMRTICDGIPSDEIAMISLHLYQRYLGARDASALAHQEELRLYKVVDAVQRAAIKRVSNNK